jgi:hypothetical protein
MPAAHVPRYCVRVESPTKTKDKWNVVVFGNGKSDDSEEELPDFKWTRNRKQIEHAVNNYGLATQLTKSEWLKYLGSLRLQHGRAPR